MENGSPNKYTLKRRKEGIAQIEKMKHNPFTFELALEQTQMFQDQEQVKHREHDQESLSQESPTPKDI